MSIHTLRRVFLLLTRMDGRSGVSLALVLTLVVAGCTGTIPGSTPSNTPGETDLDGVAFEVTVRDVIDGDTVAVAFSDGTVENVRLLGVDTPEVRADTQPEEYEGIPDTEAGRAHLRTWGEQATEFAQSRLTVGETIRIETDATADRRGTYGRLLVYLYDDGDLFNQLLLEEGYARLFDTPFEKRSAFADAEATAMEDGVGLWGYGRTTSADATIRRPGYQIPNVARSMSRVPGPRPTAMMAIRRMIA
jgi:micrococcal nuclease